MEDYSTSKRRYDRDQDNEGGDNEYRGKELNVEDGLGGYGDDDFTDVHSLVSLSKEGSLPEGCVDFTEFPQIPKKTIDKLKDMGITSLFPIQSGCFSSIYKGKDLIGRDLTGTGKTLAFCIPIVERFRKEGLFKQGSSSLKAIILAPTRELALQVSKVLKWLKHHGDEFKVITVYGGVPIDVQTKELRNGVDFFVGTTGRVLDHIRRGNINFEKMKAVVLDEADQMLNMGFAEEIEKIMECINSKVKNKIQVCLFSATIPEWIKEAWSKYMDEDYDYINLAENLTNKTPRNVTHILINTENEDRSEILDCIFGNYCQDKDSKSIVFTATKSDARLISQLGVLKGRAEALHGDVPQKSREWVLKRFREGKTNTLVATDVASRGLDIPRVNLIIQIEPPKDPESYIHRSGRTARAGNQGVCITLYDTKSRTFIDRIENLAGIEFKEISPEDLKIQSGSSSNSNSSSSKSLLGNSTEYSTYVIKGNFESKGEAYKKLCTCLSKSIVDRMKSVKLLKNGEGVCFDIKEDDVDELKTLFKNYSQNGFDQLSLEKAKSLPRFE